MKCVDLTPDKALWRVFRLDDHGNRFEVASDLTAEAANQMIAEYDRKGHKQTYCKEMQRCARSRS